MAMDRPPWMSCFLTSICRRVDGLKVLEEFRKHPACAQTPVMILTSSHAPKDRARVEALGANVYFRKPSDLAEFMALGALVKALVERNPA